MYNHSHSFAFKFINTFIAYLLVISNFAIAPQLLAASATERTSAAQAAGTAGAQIQLQVADGATGNVVQSITAGGSAYAWATATTFNGAPAAGTLSFGFFNSADCSGPSLNEGNFSLNASGMATSRVEAQLPVGTYSFQAILLATANSPALVSACRTLDVSAPIPSPAPGTTVSSPAPSLAAATHTAKPSATQLAAAPKVSATIHLEMLDSHGHVVKSLAKGGTIKARASLTGRARMPAPTGELRFGFFSNAKCTGTAQDAGTITLSSDNMANLSNSKGPLSNGHYSLQAFYKGDSHYRAAKSACTALTVSTSAGTTSSSSASSANPFAATVGTTTIGSCLYPDAVAYNLKYPNNQSPLPNSCTAKDMKLPAPTNITIVTNGCYPGGSGTVTFSADYTLTSTAATRYNVGIYFNISGQANALDAPPDPAGYTCSVTSLSTASELDKPADSCGDITKGASITTTIPLTIPCSLLDATGTAKLANCVAWQEQANQPCANPLEAVSGAPSKCNCQPGSDYQVPLLGDIKVLKTTYTGDQSNTPFNFTLTGTGTTSYGPTSLSAVGNSLTPADFSSLTPGTYKLQETSIPLGWSLLSASCTDGTTTFAKNTDGSIDITVGSGKTVQCTFNDDNRSHITAHKFNDLNGDGTQGSGEPDLSGWTMFLYAGSGCSGTPLQSLQTDALGNALFTNLIPGSYSVREENRSGWTNTNNFTNLCQDVTLTAAGCLPANFGNRQLVAPDITTQASSPSFTLGGSVTDTATISGAFGAPTGTVNFFVCGPTTTTPNCSIGGTQVGNPVSTTGATSPTSATSGTFTPTDVGQYCFRAEYTSTSTNYTSASHTDMTFECFTVDAAHPSITTTAVTPILIGGSITDTAHLSGGVSPVGTITFTAYGPNDATCSLAPVFTSNAIPVNGNGDYTSNSFTPLTAGTYLWIASFSDGVNNVATSTKCGDLYETSVVNPGTPSIATTPTPSTGTVGAVLYDSASVSGLVNPTGFNETVTFTLYGPGDTTCSQTPVFGPQTVSLNLTSSTTGTASTTGGLLSAAVGTYHWTATYHGDANNATATSGCSLEPVTVTAPSFQGCTLGFWKNHTTLWDSFSDPIVQAMPLGYQFTTTTLFNTYFNLTSAQSGFSDTTTMLQAIGTPGGGKIQLAKQGITALLDIVSINYQLTSFTDLYTRIRDSFLGVPYNGQVEDPGTLASLLDGYNSQNDQCPTAGKVTPTMATIATSSVSIGGSIADTATFTGANGTPDASTVTFNVYAAADTTCLTPLNIAPLTSTYAAGVYTYTSASFTPAVTGTYIWEAFFAGDAYNNMTNSGCGGAGETSTVGQASPTISIRTTPTPSTGTVGAVLNDSATVSGGVNPTGTVKFTLFSPSDSTCSFPLAAPFTETVRLPIGGTSVSTTIGYKSVADGTYNWTAVYSGDANNNSATSGCSLEPVVITAPLGCTLTQGFWKNHNCKEVWPVQTLTIGGHTYTREQLVKILQTPPKDGNAALILIHQLIAAELNIAAGASSAPVAATIADANALLAANCGNLFTTTCITNSTVSAQMIADSSILDQYNNGLLGVPHCSTTLACPSHTRGHAPGHPPKKPAAPKKAPSKPIIPGK